MSRVNSLIRKYEKRLALLLAQPNVSVDQSLTISLLKEVVQDLTNVNRDIDLDELHGAN